MEIKTNTIINQFSIYLLIIFPALLVTGPFLAELSMNLIIIFFLYKTFYKKKFDYFNNKFFILFILFYIYIFVTIFFSNYTSEIIFKHYFYLRFIVFVFAIVDLLKENKNLILLFYKFLTVTILIVSLDGMFQFIFGYNVLGFEKIRIDRLTGFFDDKMILGSFLSRLFPLMIALLIYNYNYLSKNFLSLGFITILISFFTIILSGERMAFYTNFIFILSVFFLLNLSKKIKLSVIVFILLISSLTLYNSPVLLDRHLKQTVDQISFNFKKNNFFSNFIFYENIYKTALNGFLDKKYFGQGARSFRLFCSEENLISESYYENNFELKAANKDEIIIKSVNAKVGDRVKEGDNIFSFSLNGVIQNISFNHDIVVNIFSLDKDDIDKKLIKKNIKFNYSQIKNGCTSHPHNFYLQLLSETGLIGFLFLIILFFYLILIVLKNFLNSFIKKKIYLSNFQICLLTGFIISLLPIIPNGNFFNNWLNMIMFLPIGFYIYGSKKV